MNDLQNHPAADLFPLLSGDEYESFKKDIADNGLLEPIWLCDGKILDGRNRYRACGDLGLEPKFRAYEGDSPLQFAWSLNGKRRHLSPSQLAAIAVKMLPPLKVEAQVRQHNGTLASIDAKGSAIDNAARIVGVGAATVERAERVQREDPALFAQVEAGEITVNKALTAVRGRDEKRPQRIAGARDGRIEIVRKLAAEGYRASQIAEEIGVSEQTIRQYARDGNVTLPDAAIGRVHKIDARRVIETTVFGLEGNKIVFDTIRGGAWDITAEEAKDWHASLGKSIKELNWLRNKLGVIANGN